MEKTYSYEGRCYTTEFENREMWNFYLSSSKEGLDFAISAIKQNLNVAKICNAQVVDGDIWEVTVVIDDKYFESFKTFLDSELGYRFV